MSPAILSLAEKLSTGCWRYLGDQLAPTVTRRVLSFDGARRPAIVADRLRRQSRAAEYRNGFHAEPLPIEAPISLMDRKDRRQDAG